MPEESPVIGWCFAPPRAFGPRRDRAGKRVEKSMKPLEIFNEISNDAIRITGQGPAEARSAEG